MGGNNGIWWGGGSYRLGGDPSPHVAGLGREFLAKHHQPGPVADLGVWEGRNLEPLLTLGVALVATDTPKARDAAATARTRYPMVRYEEALLNKLPFGKSELGGALCWRVLHNLTGEGELIAAFAEIGRVLALGAPLVLAVRSEHQQDFWATRHAFLRRYPNGNGGIREDIYFTRGSVRFIAELLGFRVVAFFEDAEGGEEINGTVVKNHYLIAHLIKAAEPARGHLDMANRLIVRVP